MNVNQLTITSSLITDKRPVANNQLILLCGLPYSGKSTFAEKLAEHNFCHLWATKLKKQYELNDDKMLDLTYSLTERLLAESYNVVFDFLNHTAKIRQPFIQIAEALGKAWQIIFFDTPRDVIEKRRRQIKQDGGSVGRTVISTDIIEAIAVEFEPPVGDHVTIIRHSDESESFLGHIREPRRGVTD